MASFSDKDRKYIDICSDKDYLVFKRQIRTEQKLYQTKIDVYETGDLQDNEFNKLGQSFKF